MSRGIYAARFSTVTGVLQPLGLAGEMENPSFLCLHPSLPTLYAVSEVNSFGGEATGGVLAWRMDPVEGRLTLLSARATGGRGPCHIAVDQGASMAAVANYVDASVVSYRVEQDGALSAPTSFFRHVGSSLDVKRQAAAHAHQIAIAPDTHHIVVPDLGSDRLYLYEIDRASARLREGNPEFVATRPGLGPRHMAFHPSGRLGYLLGELDSSISSYRIDPVNFEMSLISSTSLAAERRRTDDQPAEIAMDASGRFLYCSNRGSDELVVYAVRPDGRIERKQRISSGMKGPRHFAIGPTDDFLFVAGQEADAIGIFRRNTHTGLLTETNTRWEVSQPACVAFACASVA